MPKIVPDIVQTSGVFCAAPTMTVREAAVLMNECSIAAVLICKPDGGLAGIMTERDIAARVVARGLDPNTVTVSEVMTHNPDTLGPDDRPEQALRMMRARNYRHIPVVDEDHHAIGMVSVRDLYAFVIEELSEDLRAQEGYIRGKSYGATH